MKVIASYFNHLIRLDFSLIICLKTNMSLILKMKIHTTNTSRASKYIFLIFEGHFFIFKELFSENSVLMYSDLPNNHAVDAVNLIIFLGKKTPTQPY